MKLLFAQKMNQFKTVLLIPMLLIWMIAKMFSLRMRKTQLLGILKVFEFYKLNRIRKIFISFYNLISIMLFVLLKLDPYCASNIGSLMNSQDKSVAVDNTSPQNISIDSNVSDIECVELKDDKIAGDSERYRSKIWIFIVSK